MILKGVFRRLAGLLELADEEFLRIKNEIFALSKSFAAFLFNA